MPIIRTLQLVLIGIVIFSIAFGIYYISGLRADIATSEANNLTLIHATESQTKLIKQLQSDAKFIQRTNKVLTVRSNQLKVQVLLLKRKFNTKSNGQSRDFGDIARIKPELIKKLVNNATLKVNNCINVITNNQSGAICAKLISTK